MASKIDNFIVDKIVLGAMKNPKTSETAFTLSQISNPQLQISSDSTNVTDAAGNTIMSILKAKKITLTGDSAVFDLSLLGAANAAKGVVGVTDNVYLDTIAVSGATVTLTKTPKDINEITHIYVLSKTNSLAEEYTLATTASATAFAIAQDATTHVATITLPTGVTSGKIFVTYTYETTANATSITANMADFPKAGEFVMQILGYDVCDKSTQLEAYLIIPNALLSCDTSITFQSQISQNFTITALSDYCTDTNVGFKLVIPND